ncbi:MAG: hypothetical protein IH840_05260 [Candidatus Heimdallarchaeota archaeon]|nr:hypothetical protein [Candidatus Heimdallarchaeota archaeon]
MDDVLSAFERLEEKLIQDLNLKFEKIIEEEKIHEIWFICFIDSFKTKIFRVRDNKFREQIRELMVDGKPKQVIREFKKYLRNRYGDGSKKNIGQNSG